MLARIRKSVQEKDAGFTLVELLVVMIIIGILAAIAIPVFLNQRVKAVDSSMKSDLRTIAQAQETYFVDNQAYLAADNAKVKAATPGGLGVALSTGNEASVTVPAATARPGTFCVVVTRATGVTAASQNWVYISDKGGIQPSGTTTCS